MSAERRRRGRGSEPARPRSDLVYGTQAVREALRGRRAVVVVHVSERVAEAAWLASAPRQPASDGELTHLAGSPDHQGVVAIVEPFTYVDAEDLLAVERPLIVALDGITDPQNLGSVLRSAECAGATGVVVPRHGSAPVTAAVCRASAGAAEHVALAEVANLADWLSKAKTGAVWSFSTAADGRLTHDEADLRDGAIIVIGSEGRGVRPRVREACDDSIRIPIHGHVSSLNAGVAAAVILFEAQRQRRT